MNKGKKTRLRKIVETVSIDCASAKVVVVVEHYRSPDSASDIDALDYKSNPRNFERLVRYFIATFSKRYGVTQRKFCQVVPRQVIREALRQALKYFQPQQKHLTTYASWWVYQGIRRYLALLPPRPRPPLVQKLYTTGGGR